MLARNNPHLPKWVQLQVQSVRRTGLQLCAPLPAVAPPCPCCLSSPDPPGRFPLFPIPSPTQHDTLPALGISIRPPRVCAHPTTAHPLVRKTPTNQPTQSNLEPTTTTPASQPGTKVAFWEEEGG